MGIESFVPPTKVVMSRKYVQESVPFTNHVASIPANTYYPILIIDVPANKKYYVEDLLVWSNRPVRFHVRTLSDPAKDIIVPLETTPAKLSARQSKPGGIFAVSGYDRIIVYAFHKQPHPAEASVTILLFEEVST